MSSVKNLTSELLNHKKTILEITIQNEEHARMIAELHAKYPCAIIHYDAESKEVCYHDEIKGNPDLDDW